MAWNSSQPASGAGSGGAPAVPIQSPAERLLWRRLATALGSACAAAGLLALAWRVLAADGWTLWEGLIFLCFVAFAPWLGLSAVAGILVRLLARDPAALVLPGLRALPPGPPRLRVLVAVCVRLEDMAEVLPMDFLDRHAGRFDAMLLLDADSRMSATTARRPSATRLT